MRSGFWLDLDTIREDEPNEQYDFSFMDQYSYNGSKLNAYDFLHGMCNEFADFLHRKYGYQLEAVKEYGCLIHMYCTTEIYGKTHYIDVRGICDDWDEFMQDFTDNGLWENSDCTRYIEYRKIPKQYRLREENKKIVEYFEKEFDCYKLQTTI